MNPTLAEIQTHTYLDLHVRKVDKHTHKHLYIRTYIHTYSLHIPVGLAQARPN